MGVAHQQGLLGDTPPTRLLCQRLRHNRKQRHKFQRRWPTRERFLSAVLCELSRALLQSGVTLKHALAVSLPAKELL